MKRGGLPLALGPMTWLGCAIIAAVLPQVFVLSPAVAAMVASMVGYRWISARAGVLRPPLWARAGLLLLGAALAAGIHGTNLGLETGLSAVILLLGAKYMELHTQREFMLMAALTTFLAGTTLISFQSPAAMAWVLFACAMAFGAVVRFHVEGATVKAAMIWKEAFGIMGMALPVVVAGFVFFPRMHGGFLVRMAGSLPTSGMADVLEPGTVGSLLASSEVAFRVDFPEGYQPGAKQLYWRGLVLWECGGLRWTRGLVADYGQRPPPASGPRVEQRISLEPHGRRWMFALDHPVAGPPEARFQAGAFLENAKGPVARPMSYRVVSNVGPDRSPLYRDFEGRALAVPAGLAPRAREFAARLARENAGPEAIAAALMRYFRGENFRYSLDPGAYRNDAVDEFLFERRVGFCEHYAAAFATVMRLAGVPSRIVVGYRGGSYSRIGTHMVIRQSDAHAWVEIYGGTEGWLRYDPVEAIDPSRMDSGLAGRVLTDSQWFEQTFGRMGGSGGWFGNALETVRAAWDTLDYQWNVWVAGFDEEMRVSVLLALGLRQYAREAGWLALGLALAGSAAAAYLAWRRRASPAPPALTAYRKMCGRLARLGLPKRDAEGPEAFAQRVQERFPEIAPTAAAAFADWIAWRYGSGDATRARVAMRRLTRALRRR